MLLEMDNFSGITVFTTNFGQNYDSAFVRRIIGHIEFTLPDFERRKEIFNNLIPSKLPIELSEEQKDKLISGMEGLSGGDLLNVVIYASSAAVERDGADCKVTIDDFAEAAAMIMKAKKEIGVN